MAEAKRFLLAPQHDFFRTSMERIDMQFDPSVIPLLKVGVTVKQLEQARLNEKLRIADRLDKIELFDPVRRVGRALRIAAKTEYQHAYAERVNNRNRSIRYFWRGQLESNPNVNQALQDVKEADDPFALVHEERGRLYAGFWVLPEELGKQNDSFVRRLLYEFGVPRSLFYRSATPEQTTLQVGTDFLDTDLLFDLEKHTVAALITSPEKLLEVAQY